MPNCACLYFLTEDQLIQMEDKRSRVLSLEGTDWRPLIRWWYREGYAELYNSWMAAGQDAECSQQVSLFLWAFLSRMEKYTILL